MYIQYQVAVKLLGSFRLTAGKRHLHRYCIFTEQVPETVLQSLHHSCASELTRQGISLIYSWQMDSIFILTFRSSDVRRWSLIDRIHGLIMHYCMLGSFWCNYLTCFSKNYLITVPVLQDSFAWTLNLRTVIVTADIHPGLQRSAWYNRTAIVWPSGIGQVSPPIHPLTSSQGAVFLVNSWLGIFRCGPASRRRKGRPYP